LLVDCCVVVGDVETAPKTPWEPGRSNVSQAAGVQVVERIFQSIVRLDGVQKFFGPVRALYDIDLAIGRNEIVMAPASRR
jgi:hypothetical protein